MKLYIDKAKELIGQRVDCYRRMFGNYPLIIKQREDGTIYTKDTHGVCCDVPEREDDFNCYHFDFIVSQKIDEIIEYYKSENVSCKKCISDTDDYEDHIAIFSYGNLTREIIMEKIEENNLCVMFFESSIREEEYKKAHRELN